MGCNKSNVTRPWNREHLMAVVIPSFIWGHQFLVFVIIMGDCNQNFTPTSLCCFYALWELFSYEQRGFKQLPHSPKVLGGRGGSHYYGITQQLQKMGGKFMLQFLKNFHTKQITADFSSVLMQKQYAAIFCFFRADLQWAGCLGWYKLLLSLTMNSSDWGR